MKIEIISKRTSYYSPWQNGVAERANGIIRQELTYNIIPINEVHLTQLLKEYVSSYHNTHRTHQGINCKTPTPLPEYKPTTLTNTKLGAMPVLNRMYHTYNKAS